MIFFIIAIGILIRLFPHPANFAPITAFAIFGGAHLNKKYAFILPILIMLISDYLLLYINPYSYPYFNLEKVYPISAILHSTTIYVYCSFLISGLIGIYLKKQPAIYSIIFASFLASVQFFIITNFGVWASGYYPQNVDGLMTCYIAAIPFFKGTLVSDLFYTTTLFTLYKLAKDFILHRLVFTYQKTHE